jgi:hypothetical protein
VELLIVLGLFWLVCWLDRVIPPNWLSTSASD